MLNRIGIKCASMILFMMFVFTSCVGSFRGNAETVNLPQRAVIDYDETISQVDYVVWDYNDDGYNESIDFSLLLKSTGPSESVSLRVKLWNSTTLIKEDILYAEATLQGVSVAWWFDASKTDYYTFNFTLYDESHSKEEDWYNLTNILLETPGDYYVSLEAVAFDDDGDHCNDDIRVHCEDPSGPVLNADVYIDGEFYGFTNANGNFEAYDFTEGYHTIDIFYGQFHNSTWVYTDEISSGGNMMSLTFETFDDDDDGYKDDVKITAYSDFNTVVIGAVVTIDGVNVGMTGLDGSITAYDFEIGWHYVTAQRLMLSAYGEFYSEGSGNENPYDEY
ncbi:MAG: hypothetical protein QXT63_08420, partial [Thermoplasmata archaeon]